MKDFYYILGTSNNATAPEIDAAYQKLARKFRQTGEEQDEFMVSHFREIAEAYDMLRDSARRRKYDDAFRRNQIRRLAVFKLKYLNIAVAITFLIITALFADYVVHAIRGRTDKNAVSKALVPAPAAAALPHPPKYHRLPAVAARKSPPVQVSDTAHTPANTVAPPAVAPTETITDSTYTTTLHANITGIVYLHQSADYNSAVLAKIPDASEIRVMHKGPAYYKVMFNGQTGYVLKSSVGRR